MRFAITARAMVKQREREEREGQDRGQGSGMTEILAANVRKVTRFRQGGEEELEREVRRLESLERLDRRPGGRRRRSRGEIEEEDEEEVGEGQGSQDDYYQNQPIEGERDEIVERTPQGNDLMRPTTTTKTRARMRRPQR
jgi:hypothetical protein